MLGQGLGVRFTMVAGGVDGQAHQQHSSNNTVMLGSRAEISRAVCSTTGTRRSHSHGSGFLYVKMATSTAVEWAIDRTESGARER